MAGNSVFRVLISFWIVLGIVAMFFSWNWLSDGIMTGLRFRLFLGLASTVIGTVSVLILKKFLTPEIAETKKRFVLFGYLLAIPFNLLLGIFTSFIGMLLGGADYAPSGAGVILIWTILATIFVAFFGVLIQMMGILLGVVAYKVKSTISGG